jgi:chromate reductase
MLEFKTAVIVGSLRKESFNLKLAKSLIKLGAGQFRGAISHIDDLPLYNQDLDGNFPASAQRFKEEIKAADAVLFVTPEYNRSVPGVLKNAIDWASRPYGTSAWAKKPVAIAGTSPSATGTAVSQSTLRSILVYLEMAVMGQPEVYLQFKDGLIDIDGNITNDKTREFLANFVRQFSEWVKRVKEEKNGTQQAA